MAVKTDYRLKFGEERQQTEVIKSSVATAVKIGVPALLLGPVAAGVAALAGAAWGGYDANKRNEREQGDNGPGKKLPDPSILNDWAVIAGGVALAATSVLPGMLMGVGTLIVVGSTIAGGVFGLNQGKQDVQEARKQEAERNIEMGVVRGAGIQLQQSVAQAQAQAQQRQAQQSYMNTVTPEDMARMQAGMQSGGAVGPLSQAVVEQRMPPEAQPQMTAPQG